MQVLYQNVVASTPFYGYQGIPNLLTYDLYKKCIWSINWGEWISTLELIVRIAIST